jgi:4-amino-4-deoxy-L-arabinose transferase-like glycosyltransferase
MSAEANVEVGSRAPVATPDASAIARRRRALTIGIALALSTGFKLWLALTTFGTNDVRYWQTFMKYIVEKGSVTIYRDVRFYNHPPAMSGLLWLMHRVAAHAPNGFPFVMRLPAILADVGSTLLIYRLVAFGWDRRRALFCALGVALSPILVLVSGFHGNTDPVFMCLVLLAAERLLLGKSPFWSAAVSGAILGAAINVKLVPLMVVPVFFFQLDGLRPRLRFAGALAVILALGFGYHFFAAGEFFKRNVLDYSGLKGIWGLTEMALRGYPAIVTPAYVSALKLVIAAVIVARAAVELWRRHRSPADARDNGRAFLRSLGLAFLTFMLLTPGFGVQYLAWLAIAAFLIDPVWAVGYNLLGGWFAFVIYHYWNRGFPWNVADSDIVGAWKPAQALVGRWAWIYLIVWAAVLAHGAVQRWRGAGGAVTRD